MKSNTVPALRGVRRKFCNGGIAALSHLPKIFLKCQKEQNLGLPQLTLRVWHPSAVPCVPAPALQSDASGCDFQDFLGRSAGGARPERIGVLLRSPQRRGGCCAEGRGTAVRLCSFVWLGAMELGLAGAQL